MNILVASADRASSANLTAILGEDGHDVRCHANPATVLRALKSEKHFDVLITAIDLPSISGLELSWEARLRAEQGHPIHVIVIAGSGTEEALAEALDCGADDCIAEPLRKSELLARLRAAARLLHFQREQIRFASFDSLTGLRNRRSFFEALEKCNDSADATSVIMLDIDYFKKVNDTHGHEVGDDVLREVGKRLARYDKAFSRLGGEEFGLLLRMPLRQATNQAEIICKIIADKPCRTGIGPLDITASLGVAARLPGVTLDQMMKDADVALYASKASGRNRVTASRTTPERCGDNLTLSDSGQSAPCIWATRRMPRTPVI